MALLKTLDYKLITLQKVIGIHFCRTAIETAFFNNSEDGMLIRKPPAIVVLLSVA